MHALYVVHSTLHHCDSFLAKTLIKLFSNNYIHIKLVIQDAPIQECCFKVYRATLLIFVLSQIHF